MVCSRLVISLKPVFSEFLSESFFGHEVTCTCGATYEITEDDGIPGCRDVERFYCQFCGKELASHHGDCMGHLLDDSGVDVFLKSAKQDKDSAMAEYIKKHGYKFNTEEYEAIHNAWEKKVSQYLHDSEAKTV